MPTLYLLRHGNAGFGGPGQGDHDRALNQAGVRAGVLVGRYLAQIPARLDLVLCSSAQRTRQTWEQIAPCLDNPPEARFEDALYLCGALALQRRICALPKAVDTAMIIAHNPDMHETALFYGGAANGDLIARLQLDFPPAALVALQFDRPWAELSSRSGRLLFFVVPRDLV